ncbi:unnamed protein product [Calypogeia fissa]
MHETRLLFRCIGELACSVFASVVFASNIALLLIGGGFALSSHVAAPTRNIALLSIPTKEEEDFFTCPSFSESANQQVASQRGEGVVC